MQIVRSHEELTRARANLKGSLALVPTMGALHRGHLALVDQAKHRADHVAASIFVNPTQFGPSEDFGRYPRRESEDARLLEEAGCDLLWMPRLEDMYPQGFSTRINVSGISDRWEGEARPGHFDGVATVVAKLLLSVRPDQAFFGEKDFQQLAVIRRLVEDLDIGVEIRGVPTVREEDGLALSSRNAYLSERERDEASSLYRTLVRARDAILAGEPIQSALGEARSALLLAGFSNVDYFAFVDSSSLEPLEAPGKEARLIAAASLGTTRLIDNLAVPKNRG